MPYQQLIKICGVKSEAEAELCLEAGADLIGLNFYPPSPRCIDMQTARWITGNDDIRRRCVAVVVDMPTSILKRTLEETGIPICQLHGNVDETIVDSVMQLARVIRAFRLRDPQTAQQVVGARGDWLLVDGYRPGQHGGTGVTCDWSLAARVNQQQPILLAGGLTPDNIADAIRQVKPLGVDTASGVEESPGVKDPAKIKRFVATARQTFATVQAPRNTH